MDSDELEPAMRTISTMVADKAILADMNIGTDVHRGVPIGKRAPMRCSIIMNKASRPSMPPCRWAITCVEAHQLRHLRKCRLRLFAVLWSSRCQCDSNVSGDTMDTCSQCHRIRICGPGRRCSQCSAQCSAKSGSGLCPKGPKGPKGPKPQPRAQLSARRPLLRLDT